MFEQWKYKGQTYKLPIDAAVRTAGVVLKGEDLLAYRVALFLRENYPDVVYRFDASADLYMGAQTKIIAARVKLKYKHDTAYPDLFIAEPRVFSDASFAGAYIELKNKRKDVLTKKGTVLKKEHLQKQHAMLVRLSQKGYFATFAWSDDENVFKIMVDYLS